MTDKRSKESPEEELHELHEEKDAQVLEREPLETELMEEHDSDLGEDIDGVDQE